jgi:diaminohydroxyphosphoribosylaminopyrimidine deaminase/5-amino-6-(5-phosphoribosylamino)uracil reductase
VAKVFAAMVDPNPKVAGKGLAMLNQTGVEAVAGLLEAEARQLNPGFIKRMTTGMPYVRCKLAMSLDGKTALSSGASKWITGDEARRDVQRWRARSCAVITGSGTVLADDPMLTVRENTDEIPDQPLRAILDRRLRTPPAAALFQTPGRIIIFTRSDNKTAADALTARGGEVIVINDTDFAGACLQHLALRHEVNEVMVEAGPTLSGSLVRQGLVDELLIYQAPVLLGDSARSLLELPELTDMYKRMTLNLADLRHVGDDLRFIYRLNNHG